MRACFEERELAEAVDLCGPGARLNPAAVGWSRRPLHRCNIAGHWLRKKKWDYWCVTSDRHLFSVTLSNLDYMGLAFAYFLDFGSKRFVEKTVMAPFGAGCGLGVQVGEDVSFRSRAMTLSFTRGGSGTRLRVSSPSFGGVPLEADLVVERPAGHETLNVVVPWSPKRFQFTSKQNALPASGTVRLGGGTVSFQPGQAFACLDFGRGVWPYSSFWNWASGSGQAGGHTVGLNLGGGWTDGTGVTENGLTVDGRVTKLSEDVAFTYDPRDFAKPWAIRTTRTDRVDLVFEPFFERVARSDILVVRSEVHQLIGRFAGTVVPDPGKPIRLEGLVGWAEEHRARW